MEKSTDKKKEAESTKETLKRKGSFSESEKPSIVEECPYKRAARKTTQAKTLESKSKEYGGLPPVDRDRRASGNYSNLTKHEEFGTGSDKRESLNAAIKNKKIWSGDRKDVPWSTGFADDWWDNQADDNKKWVCSKKILMVCKQPVAIADHSKLEIGHIEGFYTIMHKLEPKMVCDGATHWEVYLYDQVVAQNEKADNLEPQCRGEGCNRHSSQQKKDERGLGNFFPVDKGKCPGNCGTKHMIDFDGDWV